MTVITSIEVILFVQNGNFGLSHKVSSTHKVLVRYMKTFDPAVQTGMLLEVTAESSKKKKKIQKAEKVQSSKVSQTEEVEKKETSTKAKRR